jgi:2-keto-4-pentenoate hydratase/2-oxohepta-3-ene-1,7-dioic acid hydratase in catechol pathway
MQLHEERGTMRIAQYYDHEQVRVGMIAEEFLVPLDFRGSMMDLMEQGKIPRPKGDALPLQKIRFAAVVSKPSKIIALGLNYLDHARESKGAIPRVPLLFAKLPNSLTGHMEPITWSSEVTKKVDFEAELAVIIGKKIYRPQKDQVLEAIFGYACANDVSARDLQFSDGQWVRGKSLDTFCPIGPWIVTRDEISDPHSLKIKTILNGMTMQDSNTNLMIFKIPEVIHFISQQITLLPGDVILTGTPHGVGAFRDPSIYMKDGDVVIVEIEKVGRLVNPCKVI